MQRWRHSPSTRTVSWPQLGEITVVARRLICHRIGQGPNPWKTVTLFEELQLPYKAQYLDFGNGANGVEGEEFKKKNPAGRVPLIYDPKTG